MYTNSAGMRGKGTGSTTPRSTTTTQNLGLKDQIKMQNLRKTTSDSTLLSSTMNLNQIVKSSK